MLIHSVASLRIQVEAAKRVCARALARAQANPTDQNLAEWQAATQLELSKRDELDAAIAREAA